MDDISTKELTRTRLRFIDLGKSFFLTGPDSELFSRWRGTFSALSRENISPDLDVYTRAINTILTNKKLEDLTDEYYALFTDPFSEHILNLTASHYIDGRNHGDTLIAIRQFIHDADLNVDDAVKLPEDALPVMLDILATLIEQEESSDTRELQSKLIKQYLSPFLDLLKIEAEQNPVAHYYSACIDFCIGYLNLEKGLSS